MPETLPQKIAKELTALRRRVSQLESAPRLANASLEDTFLPVVGRDGEVKSTFGRQADGSYGGAVVKSPQQPTPSAPIIGEGDDGSTEIVWDGHTTDFAVPVIHGHTEVIGVYSPDDSDPALELFRRMGTIRDRVGNSTVVSTPRPGRWVFRLQMVGQDRTTRGDFSEPTSRVVPALVDQTELRRELDAINGPDGRLPELERSLTVGLDGVYEGIAAQGQTISSIQQAAIDTAQAAQEEYDRLQALADAARARAEEVGTDQATTAAEVAAARTEAEAAQTAADAAQAKADAVETAQGLTAAEAAEARAEAAAAQSAADAAQAKADAVETAQATSEAELNAARSEAQAAQAAADLAQSKADAVEAEQGTNATATQAARDAADAAQAAADAAQQKADTVEAEQTATASAAAAARDAADAAQAAADLAQSKADAVETAQELTDSEVTAVKAEAAAAQTAADLAQARADAAQAQADEAARLSGVNVFRNGTFEDGKDGWNNSGSPNTWEPDPVAARSGELGMLSSGDTRTASGPYPIEPGAHVRVVYFVRRAEGTQMPNSTFTVGITRTNTSTWQQQNNYHSAAESALPEGEWVQQELSWDVPSNYAEGEFWVRIGAASQVRTTLHLDDFEVYVTAASIVSARTAADAAAAAAEEARLAAMAAQEAAGSAQDTADAAMSSANAKSRIYSSTSAPTGTANDGDTWYRWSSNDPDRKLLGIWVRESGTWRSMGTLDATLLPLVDIGAGTFGQLSGDRFLADSVGARELNVLDFAADVARMNELWVGLANIAEAQIDELMANTGKFTVINSKLVQSHEDPQTGWKLQPTGEVEVYGLNNTSGEPIIRLGSSVEEGDQFTLTDETGEASVSMNQSGALSAVHVQSQEDPHFGGKALLGEHMGSPRWHMSETVVDYLPAGARAYWRRVFSNNTSTVGGAQTGIGIAHLEIKVEPGRMYKLRCDQFQMGNSVAYWMVAGYTSSDDPNVRPPVPAIDGSNGTTTGPRVPGRTLSGQPTVLDYDWFLVLPRARWIRVIFYVGNSSSVGNQFGNFTRSQAMLSIEDVGPSIGPKGSDEFRGGNSAAEIAPPPEDLSLAYQQFQYATYTLNLSTRIATRAYTNGTPRFGRWDNGLWYLTLLDFDDWTGQPGQRVGAQYGISVSSWLNSGRGHIVQSAVPTFTGLPASFNFDTELVNLPDQRNVTQGSPRGINPDAAALDLLLSRSRGAIAVGRTGWGNTSEGLPASGFLHTGASTTVRLSTET